MISVENSFVSQLCMHGQSFSTDYNCMYKKIYKRMEKKYLFVSGKICELVSWLAVEGLISKENRNDGLPQLALGGDIRPLYDQLPIIFLFYWPHLGPKLRFATFKSMF